MPLPALTGRRHDGRVRRAILFRNAFRFDAAQWRFAEAARCTAGLGLPLLFGGLLGFGPLGVLAATGALLAGLASYSGLNRDRLRLMLTTTAVITLVTFLGILVGASSWLSALAVGLVGALLTVYGTSSPAATTVGLQGGTILIVLSGLGLPTSFAAPGAGLVLGGGLLQTLLLLFVWPVNRREPERRAVALVFAELARFVDRLPGGPPVPIPDAAPFQAAWTLLDAARQHRQRPEHLSLRQALRSAEVVRAALAGLAEADRQIRAQGSAAAEQVQAAGDALAALLREVSAEALRGRWSDPQAARRSAARLRVFQEAARHLAGARDARPLTSALTPREQYLHWAELLIRRTEALWRSVPLAAQAEVPAPQRPPTFSWEQLPGQLLGLLRPPVVRHALLYGLTLGLATLAYKLLHIGHGYWLPLTIAVVLRQDYATTLTRGVARLSGTLAGVLLATLITDLLHPAGLTLQLLTVAAAYFTYAIFLTNYAAFSLGITLYVVFSITGSGLPEQAVGLERVLVTLVGGVLALAAYLLWPSWQSRQVWPALDSAAQAQVKYSGAMLALYRDGEPADPGSSGNADVETAAQARRDARSLRVQAESVLQAAQLEPHHHPLGEAPALLRRLNAEAAQLLALHAEALDHRLPPGLPAPPPPPTATTGTGELASVGEARQLAERAHAEAVALCGEIARAALGS